MELSPQQITELKEAVIGSLERLYTEDANLISRRGLEQTLTHAFATYLRDSAGVFEWLEHFKVDIEYNKNGFDTKRTPHRPNGIRPDVIIHGREHNESNILVVEIKGWWNVQPREDDIVKLEDLTNQEEEYKYGLGIFLDLGKESCTPMYFIGGHRVDI